MKGDERGSATLWSVSALVLISATVAWALLWAAAEGTRHSAERTADSAALAAATAALHRLALRDDSDPCLAAARVATAADAELTACECVPLDCTVAVRRNLPLLGTARATSRAGPVGESGGEDDGDGEGEGEPWDIDHSGRSASGHSVGSVSDQSARSASG